MKKHLGTITILTRDRHTNSVAIQEVLTEHGKMIMSRMGVNPQRSCVKGCTGLVVITVEGTAREINTLAKKLNSLYGINAESVIITK